MSGLCNGPCLTSKRRARPSPRPHHFSFRLLSLIYRGLQASQPSQFHPTFVVPGVALRGPYLCSVTRACSALSSRRRNRDPFQGELDNTRCGSLPHSQQIAERAFLAVERPCVWPHRMIKASKHARFRRPGRGTFRLLVRHMFLNLRLTFRTWRTRTKSSRQFATDPPRPSR